jgi:hypothetical protein
MVHNCAIIQSLLLVVFILKLESKLTPMLQAFLTYHPEYYVT